jgi:hypothetical protein
VRLSGGTATITAQSGVFQMTVRATAPLALTAETRPIAAGFGVTIPSSVLVCRADAALPLTVTTAWGRVGGAASGRERGR